MGIEAFVQANDYLLIADFGGVLDKYNDAIRKFQSAGNRRESPR